MVKPLPTIMGKAPPEPLRVSYGDASNIMGKGKTIP
jgi:hypothetical protein